MAPLVREVFCSPEQRAASKNRDVLCNTFVDPVNEIPDEKQPPPPRNSDPPPPSNELPPSRLESPAPATPMAPSSPAGETTRRPNNDASRDASSPPNRRDLTTSSPKGTNIDSIAALPPPNDTNSALVSSPPSVQGGNPFPDAPTTSAGQNSANRGGNPTILIASMVCAAMFAMLLVGAFIYHRKRQTRQPVVTEKSINPNNEVEDGIFDAIPKTQQQGTEFTFEDFTAAPIGLYDRDMKTPPTPPPLPLFELNLEDDEEKRKPVPSLSAIPKHMLINTAGPMSPNYPDSGRSTPLGSRDVIFTSPFSPTETGYHIGEDQVFGAPVYGKSNGTIKAPSSSQPTYSPNTAAIAAAVVSAVQGTASSQHDSPVKDKRSSVEWPSVFDEDPFGSDARSGIVDLGYGANMAGEDGVEEFPDVPSVDPNDPRLNTM